MAFCGPSRDLQTPGIVERARIIDLSLGAPDNVARLIRPQDVSGSCCKMSHSLLRFARAILRPPGGIHARRTVSTTKPRLRTWTGGVGMYRTPVAYGLSTAVTLPTSGHQAKMPLLTASVRPQVHHLTLCQSTDAVIITPKEKAPVVIKACGHALEYFTCPKGQSDSHTNRGRKRCGSLNRGGGPSCFQQRAVTLIEVMQQPSHELRSENRPSGQLIEAAGLVGEALGHGPPAGVHSHSHDQGGYLTVRDHRFREDARHLAVAGPSFSVIS